MYASTSWKTSSQPTWQHPKLSVSVSAHPVLGQKEQDGAPPVHFYPCPPCTECQMCTVKTSPFSQSAVSDSCWHAVGSEVQLFEDSVGTLPRSALWPAGTHSNAGWLPSESCAVILTTERGSRSAKPHLQGDGDTGTVLRHLHLQIHENLYANVKYCSPKKLSNLRAHTGSLLLSEGLSQLYSRKQNSSGYYWDKLNLQQDHKKNRWAQYSQHQSYQEQLW